MKTKTKDRARHRVPFRLAVQEFCTCLPEAACLAAVVVGPLFFNKYTFNGFEPEKVYILRSIALLILGAWMLEWLSTATIRSLREAVTCFGSMLRLPLVRPMGAYVLSLLIATTLSIAPAQSFWGSYGRAMGTYTHLSCLVLFAAVAARVRTTDQGNRLVSAIVLTSVPVSLYALAQRFDIEPIIVARRVVETARVSSTLGNPVFLAAYLILVLPLLVARIMVNARAVRSISSRSVAVLALVGDVTMALLATSVVLLTGSRGAFLGLVAGLVVMVLILAARSGNRRVVGLAFGAAGAVLVFLVVLNLVSGQSTLSRYPTLRRFSQLADVKRGAGFQRSLLWNMAADVLTSREPLVFADGRVDRSATLRGIVGYGPETTAFSTRRAVPAELIAEYGTYVSPDRAHSQSWDFLLTGGVLLLVSWELLSACVFWLALRSADALPESRARAWYWGSLLVSGLAGACLFGVWLGLAFAWLGLRLGTTLGVIVVVSVRALSRGTQSSMSDGEHSRMVLIAALCGGLVAHAIETAFSFPIGTTELLIFVSMGLLVALGHSAPVSLPAPKFTAPGRSDLYVGGVLGSLLLGSLGFALLSKGNDMTTVGVISTALTTLPGTSSAATPWIVVGLGATVTWFAAGWSVGHSRDRRPTSIALVMGLSAIVSLCFWLVLGSHLAAMEALVPERLSRDAMQVRGYLWMSRAYYAFAAAAIGFLALGLRRQWQNAIAHGRVRMPPTRILWVPFVSAAVIAGAYTFNISLSEADIAAAKANQFKRTGDWALVTALYEKSVNLAPHTAFYREALGNAVLQHAVAVREVRRRLELLENAERVLSVGSRMFPLEAAFQANLGDVYLQRALVEFDPEKRLEHGRRASQYLAASLALEPANFSSWAKAAYVDVALRNDVDDAAAKARRSLALRPVSPEALALSGDINVVMAARTADEGDRERLLRQAIDYYEKAVRLEGSRYQYRAALARSRRDLGQREAAIADYRGALERAPEEQRFEIDQAIARLYLELNDREAASSHLTKSTETASALRKSLLESLRAEILESPNDRR